MPSRRTPKPPRPASPPQPARQSARPRRRASKSLRASELPPAAPARTRRCSTDLPPSPPKARSRRPPSQNASARARSSASPLTEASAAASAQLAPARIRRALRASPFAWGDSVRESHFFSLVARLPLTLAFVARLAPLVRSPAGSATVVAYRVRAEIRGQVLVVREPAAGAPVLGAVALAGASLRLVKAGTVAVIPGEGALPPGANATISAKVTDASAGGGDRARGWWPRRRPRKSAPETARTRVSLSPGFVLELEDTRRFPIVVDALSAAVAVPRAPALARFELVRPLRPGGAEPAFLVRDTQTGELLAMKLARRRDIAAADAMRQVVDERAALERVRGHPFVIDLRHAFMTDTLVVLLFEHCRNDLHHQLRLRKHGLQEKEAAAVIAQLVLAVEHVHLVGSTVHRDIKPENILFDSKGCIRLAGFGLCRILDEGIESTVARLRAGDRKKMPTGADRVKKQWSNSNPLSPIPGIIRPASPLENRPARLLLAERIRRARQAGASHGDCEEKAAHAGKDIALGPTTSGLTDSNSTGEDQPHSRISHKPESSSTVTDWGSGGNFPDSPSPLAVTMMESNGYRSPEMVGGESSNGSGKATGYGRHADLWSIGVLAHYVMTGTFPFEECDDDEVELPQPPPSLSENPKVVLSPDLPSREARSFVSRLLSADPTDRLGCGPEGFDEVRSHPWFSSIDWEALRRRDGAYQLKMLGDAHRAPTDEDEAVNAARAVAAFSGATGILGLGNAHELLPAAPARRSARMSTSEVPTSRRLSLSGRPVRAGRRASFSLSPRAKLFGRRPEVPATNKLCLAENIPGGHQAASDGDIFGFCFSSTEKAFRTCPHSTAVAVQLPPAQPPRLSFAVSQRLPRLRRQSRMVDREAPTGKAPGPAVGKRRMSERRPRSSIDIQPDAGAASEKQIAGLRRGSIERAKSGDFMPLESVQGADIPFRTSLDIVAAGRRDSIRI